LKERGEGKRTKNGFCLDCNGDGGKGTNVSSAAKKQTGPRERAPGRMGGTNQSETTL